MVSRQDKKWPIHTDDEIQAVRNVLASGSVNYWNGEEGRAFEREFSAYCSVPHAIAVANGTVALELALEALDVGPGDEVVVTPRSFIASVSCVVRAGAKPVFADVDPESQNITPESVRTVLTSRTRAVIPVHLGGWPCDMEGFRALADEHDLLLIEDCAQAHGARVGGQSVGSFGDAAAFSFCTDKIMSTGGEGGMVLFRDEAAWRRAWAFKDHGKDWDAVYNRDHPPGFRWLHESIGTNWRMTEMQAAIGRVQLGKLDDWVAQRRRNAAVLQERLRALDGLRVPVPPESVEPSYYKFYAFVRPERLRDGWDRDAVMEAVNAEGVPCLQGVCPEIYLEKAFQEQGSGPRAQGTGDKGRVAPLGPGGEALGPENRLPVARELGETSLMFLVHPTLDESDMDEVASAVERVMERATG